MRPSLCPSFWQIRALYLVEPVCVPSLVFQKARVLPNTGDRQMITATILFSDWPVHIYIHLLFKHTFKYTLIQLETSPCDTELSAHIQLKTHSQKGEISKSDPVLPFTSSPGCLHYLSSLQSGIDLFLHHHKIYGPYDKFHCLSYSQCLITDESWVTLKKQPSRK